LIWPGLYRLLYYKRDHERASSVSHCIDIFYIENSSVVRVWVAQAMMPVHAGRLYFEYPGCYPLNRMHRYLAAAATSPHICAEIEIFPYWTEPKASP
jgi:hypothetical protein